jgi:hypothetical protein
MSVLGWIFMLVSLGFVISLTAWCYAKVLTLPADSADVSED